MKTIIHIVGNRPQFIKLAVLYRELDKDKNIGQKIIHTGQHFSHNMSDVFFDELQIPLPDLNLNIQNDSPYLFTGQAADALAAFFAQQKESVVFVYGDTNTTMAAAIAAKKCGLQLIHFEAGVRTFDNSMPEEINRLITDRLSNVNYCCTAQNLHTMQQEGYNDIIPGNVLLTGDLMLDAFMRIPASESRKITTKDYIVCTIHREANIISREKLGNIITALNEINKNIHVVMPLHPHTKKRLEEHSVTPAFTLTEPQGYADMKRLLSDARAVITDSGGTSREAYFLYKRALIIMDRPFWPEIINANCALNTPARRENIIKCFDELTGLQPDFTGNIFGTGNAAKNIHEHLTGYLAFL